MMRNQRGYTLVELIIAMALAAGILLLTIAAVIQLLKMYQAGIGIRNTHQTVRNVMEDMTKVGRAAAKISRVSQSDSDGHRVDRICFYGAADPTGLAPVAVFEAVDEGAFNRMYRQDFPAVNTGTCPATGSGRQIMSPSSVSVVDFAATPINDQLLQVGMKAASTTYLTGPENTNCTASPGATLCPVTGVTTSIASRYGGSE
jgi:prepilin-type N-terminal cleavage/methylation domain-containing protein